jgi:hypothetical protein
MWTIIPRDYYLTGSRSTWIIRYIILIKFTVPNWFIQINANLPQAQVTLVDIGYPV